MPTCIECSDNYDVGDIFCRKCGSRLPEIDRATIRRRNAALGFGLVLILISFSALASGVALWVLGPSWWSFTESSTVRNVGIGLASAGGVAIIAGIALCVVWGRGVSSTNESAKDSTTVSDGNEAGEDV